jgi:hypothetical protein
MNHILEQQKERARSRWANWLFNDSLDQEAFSETLDQLITQTHQATIAECVRIAEGRKRLEMNDDYDGGYNHACDDLIEAITSNKE